MPKPKQQRRTSAGEYEAIPAGTVFRAIACHNPHAIRIALAAKRIETRVWDTAYRGPLLVCSTVRPRVYRNGYALCVVELVDCRPMVEADEPLAWVKLYEAFSWVLANVRPITPFKVTGYQRFFTVTVPHGVGYLPSFAEPHQTEMFGIADPPPVRRRPAGIG
jgi:hypothetical protein